MGGSIGKFSPPIVSGSKEHLNDAVIVRTLRGASEGLIYSTSGEMYKTMTFKNSFN